MTFQWPEIKLIDRDPVKIEARNRWRLLNQKSIGWWEDVDIENFYDVAMTNYWTEGVFCEIVTGMSVRSFIEMKTTTRVPMPHPWEAT